MKIRPFNHSDTDYEAIITIQNATFLDNLYGVEGWKACDENYPKQYLRERLVAEDNSGNIIGYSFCSEPEWSYQLGKFLVLVTVHPDYRRQGIGSALYEATARALASKTPTVLVSSTRENQPEGIRFLEKRGFQLVMRAPISQLDLKTFDASVYAHYKKQIEAAGIEICTGAELVKRDPDFWRKMYELDWEIEQDIPASHPPTKIDFDQFVKRHTDPRHGFRLEAYYFAVEKTGDRNSVGAYVGVSNLKIDHANPSKLHIGITGIVRSYRRQGLGTALKIRAMEFADVCGATIIETKNEESNPMFQLNLAMGFREVTADLEFEKRLTESNK